MSEVDCSLNQSGTVSKAGYPERPECPHGPMQSNGGTWLCREKRSKRQDRERNREYMREYLSDPENRKRENDRQRRYWRERCSRNATL